MGARQGPKIYRDGWLTVASINLTPRTDDRVNSNPQPPSQPIFNVTTSRKSWLTKFSGDHGSEGYDLWQHQLISLIKEGHNDKDFFDAIRSSLLGKAGNFIVRLGTDATVTDILEKMNSVFGDIDTEADVLATFYGAHQGPEETVADWDCRLEAGLLDVAKRQAQIPGNPQESLGVTCSGLDFVGNSRMSSLEFRCGLGCQCTSSW